jgi:hypothetical protein
MFTHLTPAMTVLNKNDKLPFKQKEEKTFESIKSSVTSWLLTQIQCQRTASPIKESDRARVASSVHFPKL